MEGRGFELVKHNLATDPPSPELLGRLIDEHGVEALLNKRSPAYKERDLGSRTISKPEAIALMQEDVNLIRRPLLLQGKKVVFGYDAEEYGRL